MTEPPSNAPSQPTEPSPASDTATPPATSPEPSPAEAPSPPVKAAARKPAEKVEKNITYIWGTGRRKRAIARVRIRPGTGKFLVNKRKMPQYFVLDKDQAAVRVPLDVTETGKTFDVFVNVHGGGISGQAGAIAHGLSRALVLADPAHQAKLRERNLLRRDPRRVERKKYGQRGARRRFQFSKR